MTNNEAELDKKIWAILYHHREGGTSVTKATKEIMHLITEQTRKAEQVDRIEVIDETGRVYVKGSIYGTPVKVELDYQDEGRTLKVFVEALKPHHKAEE